MQCLYLWPNSWISKLLYDFFDCSIYITFLITITIPTRDGNGARRGQRMGYSSPPRMVLSCFIPVPARMTRKTFSPHPSLLGPSEAPPHLVKLYFLLICPKISTIFLMKSISLIKIYLKLQLNLSHQIKLIFIKNWIIYPSV